MSLLEARGLEVAPPAEDHDGPGGPASVVRGFSLTLTRGEWVALSGPNGCGKSTLLLALAGLWPTRTGQLLLEGRPFGPEDRARQAGLAVILQDPSSQLLQPTVREELVFSARNVGVDEASLQRSLDRWVGKLDLGAELERDPQQLSAGRQQMVLIAAALLMQPLLLLADEPAAHLDRGSRERVLAAVREETAQGLGVIWVTQDPLERAAADRSVDLAPPPPGEEVDEKAIEGRALTSDGASPLLILRARPWSGEPGPCVRVDESTELAVAARGVTAIEGPNGAGKSALLQIAAGLLRLEQANAEWKAGTHAPPIYTSQYPELEIFEERARDEVAHAAVSRGVAREDALARARAALERLGLDGGTFLERRTWSLSGGEKRILTLVSSLVVPCSLRILDEPTAGLDAERRHRLAGLVVEGGRETPVLVASQDGDWLRKVGARRFSLAGSNPPADPKYQPKNGLTRPCAGA